MAPLPSRPPKRARGLRTAVVVAACAAVLASGCKKKKEDEPATPTTTTTLAENGSDASDVETHVAALVAAATLPTSAAAFDQPLRAAFSSQGLKSFFLPADCVTTTVTGTTATHEFAGCVGPWGLLRLRGKVTVAYATTAIGGKPALVVDLTGDDLTVGRAKVDFHVKATVLADGAARQMTLEAQLAGQTARDRAFSRTVAWQMGWQVGETCIRYDGSTEGNVAGATFRTKVTNLQRCRGACPSAGGSIEVERVDTGEKLRVDFDGGASAKVTTASGTSTVTLACSL